MASPFERLASRRAHLDEGNLLRSLTLVIQGVPGGINLGQGVCDMATPAPLRAGAIQCIDGGDRQTYTPYAGLPELREQIARKLQRHNGLDYGPERISVTSGSSGAFFAACATLLEPGDEVVLFEPFYSYHYTTLPLVGAVAVSVPLVGEDFALDPERLRAALTARTRAVVVNTPANPSGKVFDRADLEAIAGVLDGTGIVVLTDEVYEYMTFDGRPHVSPATVPGLVERTLTLNSFSKTFSITGWRIGFLAGPEEVVDKCGVVFDQMEVCAARPMQRGVARALAELPDAFYEDLRTTYQQKRDRFCAALRGAGFRFAEPQGAYYVLADYRDVFGDIEPYPAVLQLIERAGINAVPGDLFYADARGVRSMRFQFAVDFEVLDRACERLASL